MCFVKFKLFVQFLIKKNIKLKNIKCNRKELKYTSENVSTTCLSKIVIFCINYNDFLAPLKEFQNNKYRTTTHFTLNVEYTSLCFVIYFQNHKKMTVTHILRWINKQLRKYLQTWKTYILVVCLIKYYLLQLLFIATGIVGKVRFCRLWKMWSQIHADNEIQNYESVLLNNQCKLNSICARHLCSY